ncbi:hypothetical protein [Thermococcus barophilus]|nr:hypothetical protein [Thermococcus barophilus]
MTSASALKLRRQLEEAARLMDDGYRMAGENLWFSVCRGMLNKIIELEQRIEELEEKLEEVREE